MGRVLPAELVIGFASLMAQLLMLNSDIETKNRQTMIAETCVEYRLFYDWMLQKFRGW